MFLIGRSVHGWVHGSVVHFFDCLVGPFLGALRVLFDWSVGPLVGSSMGEACQYPQ